MGNRAKISLPLLLMLFSCGHSHWDWGALVPAPLLGPVAMVLVALDPGVVVQGLVALVAGGLVVVLGLLVQSLGLF